MKFRHELKYLINYPDYEIVKMRLKEMLDRDEHARPDGVYTVRSLYFDDYFNSVYNQKYAGILNRQKYRIRIYNYSDSVIRLERKIKSNRYIYTYPQKLDHKLRLKKAKIHPVRPSLWRQTTWPKGEKDEVRSSSLMWP